MRLPGSSGWGVNLLNVDSRPTTLAFGRCSAGLGGDVMLGRNASGRVSCHSLLLSSLKAEARLPPLDEVIVVLALVLRFGHPRQTGIAQQSLIGLRSE